MPSILWAAFILLLCLMPGTELPSISIFEFDKVVHFAVYVVLAVSMYGGWKKQHTFTALHSNTFIKILMITTLYGFTVEILQELLTADRHFDILDALANATGAVVGTLISVKHFK